jgi:hypothetical protein
MVVACMAALQSVEECMLTAAGFGESSLQAAPPPSTHLHYKQHGASSPHARHRLNAYRLRSRKSGQEVCAYASAPEAGRRAWSARSRQPATYSPASSVSAVPSILRCARTSCSPAASPCPRLAPHPPPGSPCPAADSPHVPSAPRHLPSSAHHPQADRAGLPCGASEGALRQVSEQVRAAAAQALFDPRPRHTRDDRPFTLCEQRVRTNRAGHRPRQTPGRASTPAVQGASEGRTRAVPLSAPSAAAAAGAADAAGCAAAPRPGADAPSPASPAQAALAVRVCEQRIGIRRARRRLAGEGHAVGVGARCEAAQRAAGAGALRNSRDHGH